MPSSTLPVTLYSCLLLFLLLLEAPLCPTNATPTTSPNPQIAASPPEVAASPPELATTVTNPVSELTKVVDHPAPPTLIRPAVYIIHTSNFSRPSYFATQEQWYSSILHSLAANSTVAAALTETSQRPLLYTYNSVLHGFATTLTPLEAKIISRIQGVIGVYKNRILELQSTRSPDFLGVTSSDSSVRPPTGESNSGQDVVIGLVDSGIWPESLSFDDSDLFPIGSKWRGTCENGTRFDATNCNNKLVGARFFKAGIVAEGMLIDEDSEFLSPRDANGHGTHTASTAAGSEVPGANLFGFANGTARGMASRARIAMYKACWGYGSCSSADILAAMEMAIKDGVDILSLSIGSNIDAPYYDDPISIGAFAAVRNGIFVACAAGNNGPTESTVTNTSPWITTVGAGTIDRKFPARVTLGNGEVYVGESLYSEMAEGTNMFPLWYVGFCAKDILLPDVIMGKIVVCTEASVATGFYVEAAGGAGMISITGEEQGQVIMVNSFTLPALTVGFIDGKKILSYITSAANPVAELAFGHETIIGENRAPIVAGFSSRGPSYIQPEILKPDILAPGVNIIAAWPTESSLTRLADDPRREAFNIISGTSMACPHVAGIAALLREAHPTWSPAMIRSAIMTTAVTLDNYYRPTVDQSLGVATPFQIGAGLVHFPMARDPGLVYETSVQDYVDLMCTMNYTKEQISQFVPGIFTCSKLEGGAGGLNYPSFVVIFDKETKARMLKRTLTKVSKQPETYTARVVNPRPDDVEVTVEPQILDFDDEHQLGSYKVEFKSIVIDTTDKGTEYGYIIWENGVHQVKSPLVFMWN
ncbi:Peptidase inhibitor I9 [Musa troglodytarum]|uniref:Peptidase inhibitor I9 n=1 Tax=Musa troglodytarum TaxID=320322 RepID=A0A9E7GJA6_9LILI|nr:Peptidase inhibitor I9 [Musa troglodytarum]